MSSGRGGCWVMRSMLLTNSSSSLLTVRLLGWADAAGHLCCMCHIAHCADVSLCTSLDPSGTAAASCLVLPWQLPVCLALNATAGAHQQQHHCELCCVPLCAATQAHTHTCTPCGQQSHKHGLPSHFVSSLAAWVIAWAACVCVCMYMGTGQKLVHLHLHPRIRGLFEGPCWQL